MILLPVFREERSALPCSRALIAAVMSVTETRADLRRLHLQKVGGASVGVR